MSIINTALIQKLKKIKADKTNVLELDQEDEYWPTQDYHPATKIYVDRFFENAVNYNNANLVTTERLLIEDNRIILPSDASGEIIDRHAIIFEDNNLDLHEYFVEEYDCHIDESNPRLVHFDPNDNLNGLYAVVSYIEWNDHVVHVTQRLEIFDNKIILPFSADNGLVTGLALIFENLVETEVFEATCSLSGLNEVHFNTEDDLNGMYATVSFITANGFKMYTSDKILIENDQIEVPYQIYGDVLLNIAFAFEDFITWEALEYTLEVDQDKFHINFDPYDDLNGQYAIVSYMTKI